MTKRKATAGKPAAEPQEAARVYQLGETIGGYIVTKAGLPNTCSVSGETITEGFWFAINEDAARAGQGISLATFEAQAA